MPIGLEIETLSQKEPGTLRRTKKTKKRKGRKVASKEEKRECSLEKMARRNAQIWTWDMSR